MQRFHDVKALPKVAQDALEAGYDSRSLRMLAGLEKPTVWDAEPLWRKAWEENGEGMPDESESLLIVADWVIARWEAKELDLENAASILTRMCWQNDHDRRLLPIYETASYWRSDLATDEDLIGAFQRFKLRDFSRRRPAVPEFRSAQFEEPVTRGQRESLWERLRRFFAP